MGGISVVPIVAKLIANDIIEANKFEGHTKLPIINNFKENYKLIPHHCPHVWAAIHYNHKKIQSVSKVVTGCVKIICMLAFGLLHIRELTNKPTYYIINGYLDIR